MVIDLIRRNLLLRTALAADHRRMARQLDFITFEAGQQFWGPNALIPYALFPLRGVISVQVVSPPSKHVEVGIVGRDGFAGVPLLLSVKRSQLMAVALTAGDAVAMRPAVFRSYLSGPFRATLERYVHSFMVMVANISLCNRVHAIEKLCIGRLLLIQDRMQNASFQVTQGLFSRSLGVRRASVSLVAVKLQNLGAIRYDRRGRLTIVDRDQLEKLACPCYHAMKTEFGQLR